MTHRGPGTDKLMYTLKDKEDYCIDGFALKYLLENDMCTLDAVYSWVEMERGYVMRNYIDQITDQRKLAEKVIYDTQRELKESHGNEAHINVLRSRLTGAKARKGLFKLMNNSLSGKTYQSDETYGESALVTNHKQYNAKTNGRLVLDRTIISKDMVEVQMRKKQDLASSLLWLSKIKMLDFYYNQLMRVHPDVKLYGTDTDSIKFRAPNLAGMNMKEKYQDFLQG